MAVVALAAVVAFLTGSALFFTAAADRPTALADEYGAVAGVSEYQSVEAADEAAGPRAVVFPYTTLEGPATLVVGLSRSDTDRAERTGLSQPDVPDEGVGRVGVTAGTVTVTNGSSGEAVLNATATADHGFLPARWYVARPAVVERLGPTGAFVVEPVSNATGAATPVGDGTVDSLVRGSLRFFQRGTDQLLGGFVLVVAAAGILGAVTVTSVVRMTVRDRERTIQVIRATGGPPATVLGLFALRGLALSVAAVALGYAVGVVASSVIVSVAVFAGLPTSLSPRVTTEATRLLALVYGPILAVGAVSGAIAALPAVRYPPVDSRPTVRALSTRTRTGTVGRVLSPVRDVLTTVRDVVAAPILRLSPVSSHRVRAYLRPSVLGWRAVVPTSATVAVFTALVLLVLAGGTVATPLTSSSATVLEPGAAHPVSSSVPESYASAFESQGVNASPEIVVFGVVEDDPALVRGARYDAFASVSNATLVAGTAPNETSEAVVGADFADAHDVAVGDSVALGGGVAETVDRVRVVGRYRAPGVFDDQLLVSLPTARHLSLKRGSDVNFVRLSRPVEETAVSGVQLTGLSVARPATTDRVAVRLTLRNLGQSTSSRGFEVSLGDERARRNVTLAPGNRTVEEVTLTPPRPGRYTLSVGGQSRSVTVADPDGLVVRGLPDAVPVDSAPQVVVRTLAGVPVENATVTVGDRTVVTAGDGTVRLPFEQSGHRTVRVVAGDRELTRTVPVSPNATRRLDISVRVVPAQVAAFARPSARVRLSNPWNATATRSFQLRSGRTETRRQVTVQSGGVATRSIRLSRRPRGEYRVGVVVSGTERAAATYRVTGDGRLSTVVARNTDTETGAGLGVAVATVFGNLQVIVAGLLALAGVMVGGTLVASFSRTIHARRRTLGVYRATGATPRQVAVLLFRDGLVVGSVSVVLGLLLGVVLLWILDYRGMLVFFGVDVAPSYSLPVLALVGVGAFALVLVGLGLSASAVLGAPPASLFDTGPRPPEREESR
jgi:ABC-type lipoprotein release transport system permease subunit